jgi:aromatic-L-amino-acid decarboxylase
VIVALTRAFPQYGEHGLRDLKATPSIYVTTETHHGYNKISHMTGLGRRALRTVGTDRNLKMDLADLQQRVAEDRNHGFFPLMVVGTAGTTGTGVIDPLPELARFCAEEGLWFHVDAAWGGSSILSPNLKRHLDGIEAADSITCDAHKWLSVSMGCGMFFCRHREKVAEAFRADVSYMPGRRVGPVFDPYTNSSQWSRRFIGLKLFMALAEQGQSGYVEMLEHQTRMGDLMRSALRASGWRIVNSTPLPLVCFTREGLVPAAFLAELHRSQIAWMSEARIGDVPVLRACITSFKTTEEDIHWVVTEMNRLVAAEEQYAVTGQTRGNG